MAMSARAKRVRKTLRAAKALIDEPKKWTKGKYAADKSGRGVDIYTDRAVKFCVVGALRKVNGPEFVTATDLVQSCVPGPFRVSITSYNDNMGRKHDDIMALFDCAIKKAADLPD